MNRPVTRRHLVKTRSRQILKDSTVDFFQVRHIEIASYRLKFKLYNPFKRMVGFELLSLLGRQHLRRMLGSEALHGGRSAGQRWVETGGTGVTNGHRRVDEKVDQAVGQFRMSRRRGMAQHLRYDSAPEFVEALRSSGAAG